MEGGLDDFRLFFDGISDMSVIMTSLVGDITDMVGSAISDLLVNNKSALTSKIQKVFDLIVSMLPNQIDIPGTSLFLEFELPRNMDITTNYLNLPLTALLNSHTHPFPGAYNVTFPAKPEHSGY